MREEGLDKIHDGRFPAHSIPFILYGAGGYSHQGASCHSHTKTKANSLGNSVNMVTGQFSWPCHLDLERSIT
jgi:hypothetical protein